MIKHLLLVSAIASVALASPVLAQQPTNPGQFGQDRAGYANGTLGGGVYAGRAQGEALSSRGGDNGSINRAYMVGVGSVPSSVQSDPFMPPDYEGGDVD
jgi:hypothetical protein